MTDRYFRCLQEILVAQNPNGEKNEKRRDNVMAGSKYYCTSYLMKVTL
jgi:hypothetical protein